MRKSKKSPNPESNSTPKLTGQALLEKVKELEHLSKEEKAKACGYITLTKNGQERVNMIKFLNALMEADGVASNPRNGRGGRSASYRISVQKNGNLLIGSAYTRLMGLEPGDELEVKLGRKHIHLRPVEDDDDLPMYDEDVEEEEEA
jgi:bifunctional DNA-binding transcriptional regulator/antitoxin component of YhaV-PrlF toxin-antitoxin module